MWIWLIFLLLLGITLYFHKSYYFIQYLFFLRYCILVAVILLFFPVTALEFTGNPLRNLFVHERLTSLAVVTWLAFLLAWEVMYAAGLLFENLANRVELAYDRDEQIRIKKKSAWTPTINKLPSIFQKTLWRFLLFGILALPMVGMSVWWSRPFLSAGKLAGGVILGLAMAGAYTAFVILITRLFIKPISKDPSTSEKIRDQLSKILLWPLRKLVKITALIDKKVFGKTTINLDTSSDDPGSPGGVFRLEIAAAFAVLTMAVYLSFYYISRPEPGAAILYDDVPAITFVLLLLMLIGWILPWLSFMLDRHRILPELVIIAAAAFFYHMAGTDHYYDVKIANENSCPAVKNAGEDHRFGLSPDEHYKARRKHTGLKATPPVIVVASGGGITAAYWTSIVLSKLEETVRLLENPQAGFSDTVYLVSATSGGSVGSMYFIDAFDAKIDALDAKKVKRPFNSQEQNCFKNAAGASSLNAMGWGLIYRDFWRLVFAPIVDSRDDRATAMEARWKQGFLSNMKQHLSDDGDKCEARQSDIAKSIHDPTFADWEKGVRAGWRPAAVFNAVLVESGELLQVSNVSLGKPQSASAKARKNQAGKSANKSEKQKQERTRQFAHLYPGADISASTAARLSASFPWITPVARPHLPDECEDLYHVGDGGYYDNYGVISALDYSNDMDHTLLPDGSIILVEIRASDSTSRPDPELDAGFGFATAGPIKALLAVRTTSQLERNETFVNQDQTIKSFIFELRESAPLSWHLSTGEKKKIENHWTEAHIQEELIKLCNALNAACHKQ